jgi:hypothetical protein
MCVTACSHTRGGRREGTFRPGTGPDSPSPSPPGRERYGRRIVLSRRRSLAVLLDRFHPASRRMATAVLTRGVHATRRGFTRRATPTVGLGWSICSPSVLRRRLNAAALLVSGGHPYSLAIPTYYDPPRPSPERRSGVSRLVSGGLDVTPGGVNPKRQRSVADPDP